MRRHRFAIAFLTLVALTFVALPLLRGEVFTFRDHTDYFQPLRFFTVAELRAGHLPLWNPYSASGEPWLANPQTGVFYPPAWLFLILPFATAYMLYLSLHLMILGWGSYTLFVRESSPGAALTGAVILLICGPTLSLLDVSNNLATFAWLPLVLWAALSRSRLGPLFLALAFLAGEPFFAALAAVLYALIVRSPALIFRTGALAVGFTSVQLFPFLEMLLGSDRRAGLSAAEILQDSMPARDWLRLAVRPGIHPEGFDPALSQHFIPIVYVGVPTVLLAAAACLLVRNRSNAGWFALVLFSISMSAGPAFLTQMPLTLFRYPARLLPIGALGLIALAVAGWNRLRPGPRWADLLLIGVLLIDVLPMAAPLLVTGRFDPNVVHHDPQIGRTMKFVRLDAGQHVSLAQSREAWIAGYLNLYTHRFDGWTAAPVVAQRYVVFYESAVGQAIRPRIDALSIGWFLTVTELPRSAFTPIGRVGRVVAYRYATALPMARVQTVGRGFVPAVRISAGTSSASFDVNSPGADGLAIISQQDAAGWHVKVDGIERPKLLDHGIFRAVRIPIGHHRVEWQYRPWSFFAGAIVTFLTLAAQLIRTPFVKQVAHKSFLRGGARKSSQLRAS